MPSKIKIRKNVIILIICLAIFLLLLPMGIQLSLAIHRYVVPDGSVEPRYVAKTYMQDNLELEKLFGEEYKYIYLDMDWEINDDREKSSTVTFWVFNYGKYIVYLELKDNEWIIVC